jgi:hypothetical protein
MPSATRSLERPVAVSITGRRRSAGCDAPAATSCHNRRVPSRPYLALVPWVIFTLVARRDSLSAATVAALVGAVLVSVPSLRARRPKILEMASILAFAVFVIIALVINPGHSSVLDRYARAIAAATLAVIAFGSLLLTPFTEQYARESVPRQYWNSPRFKALNRRFTALWGTLFALMAVSHMIAGAIDTRRAETLFNWVIPIALLVWLIGYMDRERRKAPHAEPGREPFRTVTASTAPPGKGDRATSAETPHGLRS